MAACFLSNVTSYGNWIGAGTYSIESTTYGLFALGSTSTIHFQSRAFNSVGTVGYIGGKCVVADGNPSRAVVWSGTNYVKANDG